MHSPSFVHAAAALCILCAGGAQAGEILLYDADRGDLPQDQRWMTYTLNPLVRPQPEQAATADGVRLDTSNNFNHSAGYFNHRSLLGFFTRPKNRLFPALDPTDGFSLGFELQIHDEDHLSQNRAGFSVILLGQDLFGIELGFWEGSIWAQSGPSFTRAETVSFDTRLDLITYQLTILNTEYLLLADGTEILRGSTRDYSSASTFPDPYDEPNMLFLGDDTTSASADFTLGAITLATHGDAGLSAPSWTLSPAGGGDVPADQPWADAPAPPPAWLLFGGVAWMLRGRARGRATRSPDCPERCGRSEPESAPTDGACPRSG
jgi:hypothetical protein